MPQREQLKELLRTKRFEEVEQMAIKDKHWLRSLVSILYEGDELLLHRAAAVWGRLALSAPSSIRRYMSRLAWQLNDESGNIGKGSPQVIAEVARHNIDLARDVIPVTTHYLDDRGMLPGVLWGIGRVGEIHRAPVLDTVPELRALLNDADAAIRGNAAWALGKLRVAEAAPGLRLLVDDNREVSIYENDEMNRWTVKEVAGRALAALALNSNAHPPPTGA
ncbi:MAG: HEAT repeat domain-containing protein [Nitrospinae bacterium]|nr:HEAT repeat domain-containing protein [Nitrospinota bacterium]